MRLAAFTLLCLLLPAAPQAEARDRTVQQWTPTAASVLKADRRFPTGDAAADKVKIENFAPDIRFDPRDLKNSHLLFSASFVPVDPPGNRTLDEDMLAAAAATFESTKIEKKDDNTFEVQGLFRMNNQQRQLIFKMNVVPGAQKPATPALVFSGQFNAPAGNAAPQLGIPAQIPVIFHVETVPAP